MNFIDVIIILIVLLSAWSGWRRGFLLGSLELIAWAGSFLLALFLYEYTAQFVGRYITSSGIWTMPVSLLLTIIIVRIIIGALVNLAIRQIPPRTHHDKINKVFGVVPGVLNGLILAALFATIFLVLPISDRLSESLRESPLACKLTDKVQWLEDRLSPAFSDAIDRSVNKLTIHPKSNESVKLPFNVTKTRVRADLEADMLVLINEERQKEGLRPLSADPEAAETARKHSGDMFARGYFAHLTPEGLTPFDRMRKDGLRFLTAGENLALAQTLTIAHTGLMNSPGHRANILHKSFGRVGIGILDGGLHGLMITQNFRN